MAPVSRFRGCSVCCHQVDYCCGVDVGERETDEGFVALLGGDRGSGSAVVGELQSRKPWVVVYGPHTALETSRVQVQFYPLSSEDTGCVHVRIGHGNGVRMLLGATWQSLALLQNIHCPT
jgi:hypothetical protein